MHEQPSETDLGLRRTAHYPKKVAYCLAAALAALWLCVTVVTAADQDFSEYKSNQQIYLQQDKRAAQELQERHRKRLPLFEAVGPDVPKSGTFRDRPDPTAEIQAAILSAEERKENLVVIIVLILIGALCARRCVPVLADYINQKFNPWKLSPAYGVDASARILEEDGDFSQFVTDFKSGSLTAGDKSPFEGASGAASVFLKEFYGRAGKILPELRQLLREIDQASDRNVKRRWLGDLQRELHKLKGEAGQPELLPVWQMAAALEGMTKQLVDRVRYITPSTLRTLSGGMELLENLCAPALAPDLLTNPPLRLMAVDDDRISRNAMAFSLRKALNTPDLAEEGEGALKLAVEKAYDVIFLDVQMPGMDGFELCTKIHETAVNRHTPVVFVTSHDDFESRAKSTLSGGHDLIGKPFLTFEITVKALTLAIQERLRTRKRGAVPHTGVNGFGEIAPIAVKQEFAKDPAPKLNGHRVNGDTAKAVTDHNSQNGAAAALVEEVNRLTAPREILSEEQAKAFLAQVMSQVKPLRELIQGVTQSTDEQEQLEKLGDFYLRLHSITPEVEAVKTHPAFRICAAVEGLLKKLVKSPKSCTTSALLTVATAVDLLEELCAPGVKADLAVNPPIKIMVVDDDPVARRAITFALQMSFKKPDNAEGGEAAVELATANPYDVIFMDIQMPGVDGFAACAKIRETEINRTTPVIYVTSHTDLKTRTQSTFSGGNDFLGKPILTAEITVKALTFALRSRIQKLKVAENIRELPPEEALAEHNHYRNRRRKARSDKQARRR